MYNGIEQRPSASCQLLLRYIRFDEARLAGVRVYRAETTRDVQEALHLLHEVYATAGIIEPNPARLHVTKYNALPSTMIFVAKKGDRVIGTLSVVLDTELGLPMDSTHRAEADSLRAQGVTLAEVVGTTCARDYRSSGVVLYLYRMMTHASLRANLGRVVMRAAPSGARFYEELMVCDRLGETRPDPLLNNKSFAALSLDLQTCESRLYRRFDSLVPYPQTPHYHFFGKDLPQLEVPDNFAITAERRQASADLVHTRFDLFCGLSLDERAYYRSVLPEVDLLTPPTVPL